MTVKKRPVYWINALTGETAKQSEGMKYSPPDSQSLFWSDSGDRVYAIGFKFTCVDGRKHYNVRTWVLDQWYPEGGFWNYTNEYEPKNWWYGPRKSDILQPVRMNQRTDGIGNGENHPRMSPWGSTANSVAGTRIMGNNSYR
jgi:hypothetical protein